MKVGTDQRGGTASPTNETPVRLDATLPDPSKGAAEVAAEALGLSGGTKGDAPVNVPAETSDTPPKTTA